MRYTFPQTLDDLKAVTRLILERQTWRRAVFIAVLLFGAVMVLLPLLDGRPHSWRYLLLNGAPWIFIALLWIAILTGYRAWMFIVALTLGLAGLIAIAIVSHHASIDDTIVNILPYLFLMAAVPLVPYLMTRRFRTNPLFQGDITLELAPEELRAIRAASTMSFRWSGIVRAAETPEYFLIFVVKNSAFYIPKRVIPPSDLPDLRSFLRAHVPSGLL